MKSPVRQLLTFAIALLVSLSAFTQIACGASDVKKVSARAAALASLVQSFDPAGQLLAENLISPDEAEAVRSKVAAWVEPVRQFDSQVTAALASNPKASLIELAPQFAGLLTRWNDLQAIKFSNAKAQLLFDKTLSAARVGVAFISAFYAARIVTARRVLEGPARGEGRLFAAAGIEYDGGRLGEARESYQRSGLAAGVNDYFGTRVSDADLRLILSAGGE
ncbi:MAG TPA: hypothetical protein VIP46_02675 [Pyrinomonadaceae bacterium]